MVLAGTLRRFDDYSVLRDEVRRPRSPGILYGRAQIPATFIPAAEHFSRGTLVVYDETSRSGPV